MGRSKMATSKMAASIPRWRLPFGFSQDGGSHMGVSRWLFYDDVTHSLWHHQDTCSNAHSATCTWTFTGERAIWISLSKNWWGSLKKRGRVHSHCAPGELRFTSWPWHIISISSPVDTILFNVECPQGRVSCHCAPGELVITSWLWNIITGQWTGHIAECPQEESAPIVPHGKLVSPVGREISPVDLSYCSMLSAPREVNSHCHCAPGELTSWLWKHVGCPHGRVLLIPRGTQYQQLPVKYYHQW